MAASFLTLAVAAQATTITFGTGGTAGFTGGGSSDGPTSVGGGITLTVTPWASGFGSASLTVNGDGYGVDSGFRDNDQIDGFGRDEGIILTFSSAVHVTNFDLRDFFACCDDADITVNGVPAGANMTGTVFGIFANESDSDFRVRSVTFSAATAGDAAVPEPASLLTGGLGLALVGLARLRTKQ